METSAQSSVSSRHRQSGRNNHMRRNMSHHKRMAIPPGEAYIYALRAAYLAYLLQPRQKRIQHVANTSKPIQRSSPSINDMVSDLKSIRDSKSTKFPHGFVGELDKRLQGVLQGREKMPEYNDNPIKRTFGAFYVAFTEPSFRKSMENERRVEGLLLIFFSKATAELQKGKSPDDESWKLLVDRHVALFVRLISSTLADNNWARDRSEMSSRLKSLETKLLQHDQDLTNAGSSGQNIEVEIPRSYEVREMPLVIRVCSIFAKPTVQAQTDIDAHRDIWTEAAALKDLKEYQNNLVLETHATLTKRDFDLDASFEQWKKNEVHEISQLMLTILQSNPELAKASSGGVTGAAAYRNSTSASTDAGYGELSRHLNDNSFLLDHPVDMSGLNLGDRSPAGDAASATSFTYIPPDARSYYRAVLKAALTHDLQDADLAPPGSADDAQAVKLLSKSTAEFLSEIAVRWRIPQFSRMVLFLDVVKEKYQHQEVALETVDSAFMYIKEPPSEPKKGTNAANRTSHLFQGVWTDRSKWTTHDVALQQSVLFALHDSLLRELFELFQQCYESKPPSIGPAMYILENHIYDDELFNKAPEELDKFSAQLRDALRLKAREKYHEMLSKNVSEAASEWEFYNVIQLGQAVTTICAKIQKRYKKNPEVFGVNPLTILVEEILPSFAADARELVTRIMQIAKGKDLEIPVQDGFELYKELVAIRQVHAQALPQQEFAFHIEGILQDFVWRWIQATDAKIIGWVEGAVGHDEFQVRQDPKMTEQGIPPTDEERHSQSAVDVYTIFNQSIDQIVRLEWDDDLQYARFMTAISKSIGRGVSRYCELLESKFAKEMDRQTPEQEAAAQRTQRERWYAAAKDFYTTGGRSGEKIEPFQFWAQSFVKINDIEYATLQLDQVEKEVNVDACAEVIQRRDPPPPPNMRLGKNSKFVFTIKIVEGEDLKAGDINGLSDPYVVLGDEYQKRLAKTRTVYQSLSPRWDETYDIMTTGPLNIIATVWDWDALGDHDCLGRTSLKLDPSNFNDFLPHEYWLDLDTQGRILLRVSMEGERDDIIFHFGKAFRTLKRTERDMTRRVTDKLSTYIHQCLSRRMLKTLLSQGTIGGVSVASVRGIFNRVSGRPTSVGGPGTAAAPTTAANQELIQGALKPLLNYFDDNFAIMKETLTDSAMILVMTRLWKEVLVTIEGLLIPPLSDKPSAQKSLEQREVDVVYQWLQILFDFFHAVDENGEALGVPLAVLKNPKYRELQELNFFYNESTESLIRTSEDRATANAARREEQTKRGTRHSGLHPSSAGGLGAGLGTRRSKSVMMSRNLGTMRKAKEEKWKEAQAEASDDIILRILRMRPEAERYLKDRSRQKERLAAKAAAEAIVQQSFQHTRHSGLQGPAGRGRGQGGLARRWDTIRE